jgi:hypothetical protein
MATYKNTKSGYINRILITSINSKNPWKYTIYYFVFPGARNKENII